MLKNGCVGAQLTNIYVCGRTNIDIYQQKRLFLKKVEEIY